MFGPKVKLSKELYDKVRITAETLGCASVEEFVSGILEREIDELLAQAGKNEASPEEIEEIANKLKGLGYLE